MVFECVVCCQETINDEKCVTCLCGFKACRTCCKRYITEGIDYAHCMSCKMRWDIGFLHDNFTKTWVNGNKEGQYRAHIKTITLEREKARIPETVAHDMALKRELDLKKERMADIRTRINDLYTQIDALKTELQFVKRVGLDGEDNEDGILKTHKPIYPCPWGECRGVVLSNTFKCGVCEKQTCKSCREPKMEDHVCNNDHIQNLELIRKDSRPCPNCTSLIYKISGCNQMFCTNCKIAFNWRTGRFVTGNIHNPHALRYQMEFGEGGALENIECGALIGIGNIGEMPPNGMRYSISSMYRVVGETELQFSNVDNDFAKSRLRYVTGEITEKEWKSVIFRKERSNERARARNEILQTFSTLCISQFRDLAEKNNKFHPDFRDVVVGKKKRKRILRRCHEEKQALFDKFVKEMETIRLFINEAFVRELVPLGTKNPIQINLGASGVGYWTWSTSKP